ncbi:MAG TPA: hypothetical protein VEY33_07145 [Gemmatimonadota bacterium]|nr:hypothetical protein [Gemmatimonadota bacterium]
MEDNVRRNRSPQWTPTILFFLVWLGASVTPLKAQAQSSTDRVWDQLQDAFTTAHEEGFKQYNYMIGYLDSGVSPVLNWPLSLAAGSSYLIVGVCDKDCWQINLALVDANDVVVAGDTADKRRNSDNDYAPPDDPMIRFTASTTAAYSLKPFMFACNVNPCGYGIGVFVK